MGQYNQAVLTTAGQALLTSILGNAGTLTFSKFQTSSYQYASGTDLSALTSLQSVEQNVVPSAGGIKDATTFYSSSTVPNTGVTVEYTNYTVGLFATDGDDEVLFAVSTAIVPDIIPVDDGGAPSTYTYTMSIGVSSTDNITVEVDDQGILRVTSIVDNLNSTSTTQPLSANQGKVLNDAKQPKTLATPLTIGGTSQTTVESALAGLNTVKAERADITSISCTGATNDTGATILNGSKFYLDDVLCKAIADIANGATFTLNTNYETTTVADDLTELSSNLEYSQEMISRVDNCTILDGGIAKRNNTVYVCLKIQQTGSSQPVIYGVPRIKTSENVVFSCICDNGGTSLQSLFYISASNNLLAVPASEASKYNNPIYYINLIYLCQ